MRPWKSFSGLSSWLIRIGVLLVITSLYLGILTSLNLESSSFYYAAGFILAALFLFAGGFFSSHGITMFAALALFILSAVHAYWNFAGLNDSFARYALLAAVSVHFLANGNKK